MEKVNFNEYWMIPEGKVLYSLRDVLTLKRQNDTLHFIPATDEDVMRITLLSIPDEYYGMGFD